LQLFTKKNWFNILNIYDNKNVLHKITDLKDAYILWHTNLLHDKPFMKIWIYLTWTSLRVDNDLNAKFFSNRIYRVLSQHNIKYVGLTPRKISSFLRPVKGNLGLKDATSIQHPL
jgi:hypothetical protein